MQPWQVEVPVQRLRRVWDMHTWQEKDDLQGLRRLGNMCSHEEQVFLQEVHGVQAMRAREIQVAMQPTLPCPPTIVACHHHVLYAVVKYAKRENCKSHRLRRLPLPCRQWFCLPRRRLLPRASHLCSSCSGTRAARGCPSWPLGTTLRSSRPEAVRKTAKPRRRRRSKRSLSSHC